MTKPALFCPECGSPHISMQAVNETQQRSCLAVLGYIILLFVPVVGWIALFLLLRGRKSKTVTYAVCQNCGHSWKR